MAGEIRVQLSLRSTKGYFKVPKYGDGEFAIDQAVGAGGGPGVVDVGTTAESIAFPDIATLGWVWFRNLDGTNYVEWGVLDSSFRLLGKLKPGEAACFRLAPGVTLQMKANTASCKVMVICLND